MNRPFQPPAAVVQVNSIAELVNAPKDSVVTALTATLKSVARYVTGNGKWGPYSFQDGVISDSTGDFPILFANREEVSQADIGTTFAFSCGTTPGGIAGLKMVEREDFRTKNTRPVLQIGKQAVVRSTSGHAPAPAEAPALAHMRQTGPSAAQPTQAPLPMGADDARVAVDSATKVIGQIANLAILCDKAADYCESKRMDATGEKFTPEQWQGKTGTFLIEGLRSGLHRTLPAGDITELLGDAKP